MPQSRDLRTIDAVIKALGGGDPKVGRRVLIDITGRSTQHITNWRAEGRLPAWTFLIISNELARTGHRMHPAVCGMGRRKPPQTKEPKETARRQA